MTARAEEEQPGAGYFLTSHPTPYAGLYGGCRLKHANRSCNAETAVSDRLHDVKAGASTRASIDR